jgi:hypothetical protein
MFDPMELERSRLYAAVKNAEAAEATARHQYIEGTMRLQSLPGGLGSAPGASGKGRTVLVLLVLTIAAIGYGAIEDAPPTPARAATLSVR